MIKHESMLQAYRLLVPYGFDVDRDDLLILTAFNRDYDAIPNARIRFARNPRNFQGIWFNDLGMVFICTTTTQHREMTIGKGWESCMLTST